MNPRPDIPRLAPNVVSLDEARAWRELQVALKAAELLAEPKQEADTRPPADMEASEESP